MDFVCGYPNITWAQFGVCNDDQRIAFEDMCRQLFACEFVSDGVLPHTNPNNPGVEVEPVLESQHEDGKPQKLISFQAKYFETSVDYKQIQDSAEKTVKYYSGKLDVVYLFCNKTLNTDCQGYKKTIDILTASGIELVPISDREVLDLARKHSRVGNYYFRNRDRAQDLKGLSGIGLPNVSVASSAAETASSLLPELTDVQYINNNELMNELVAEQVEKCSAAVINLELKGLEVRIDKILDGKLDYNESVERLQYFRFLLALHNSDKEKALQCAQKLKLEQFRSNSLFLLGFWESPSNITIDSFVRWLPETQVFIISKLFSEQRWDDIIGLNEQKPNSIDGLCEGVKKQLLLHYGLSLFNIGNYHKSSVVLGDVERTYGDSAIVFYSFCARLQDAIGSYRRGDSLQSDTLIQQLNDFAGFRGEVPTLSRQNELLVAAIELTAYYKLGFDKRDYLQQAIDRYSSYTDETQNNEQIRYYIALCYELLGDLDNAIAIYSSLDWKNNETFALRLILCLVLYGKSEQAVEDYNEVSNDIITPHLTGVYLFALSHINAKKYQEELSDAVAKVCNNPVELFAVAYYVEDENVFCKLIVPSVKNAFQQNKELLLTADEAVRFGYILLFAYFAQIELLDVAINSVPELMMLDKFLVHNIYTALYKVANKAYLTKAQDEECKSNLDAVERIANQFIEGNLYVQWFLQIKVLCAGANRLPFSMLKYSKQLFEYTHDAETARNVAALLFERNETDADAYEPYLDVLIKSNVPEHAMAVASAYLKTGKKNDAEFYAYKALYLLNGRDDYEIFKNYFGFSSYKLYRFPEEVEYKTIRGNMVVTLSEKLSPDTDDEQEPDSSRWILCLEMESAFSDENNSSLGVQHINRRNPIYSKLQGSGLGQILFLNGKKYRVVSIVPREVYAFRYILEKVQQHPEEFQGFASVLTVDDPQKLAAQIEKYGNNSERIESLLKSYNFEDSDIGLPIDAFAFGDYDQYITVIKTFLYEKDLAYYAGPPVVEESLQDCYVPALSTLVILAVAGWFSIFDVIKDRIIIPESYIDFFKDQFSKAVSNQTISPGSLVALKDGGLAIVERDKNLPAIWEALIDFSEQQTKMSVTDDERINLKIVEGMTAEKLFAICKIDKIQIDALALCKKSCATYICDDLFFRNLATAMGIRNLNFTSLLFNYKDYDYVMPIIFSLSKTNYIYTPFIYQTNEDAQRLIVNLTSGRKKKVYYNDFFRRYFKVCSEVLWRVVSNLFTDENELESN